MSDFKRVAQALRGDKEFRVFAGFDGFVDEIIHIVEKRHGEGADDYTRFETIAAFGEKVTQVAGLSTNFEMVPVLVKLGGNGPIYANALLEMGMRVTYCGNLGYPDIHPVFKPMADHPMCNVISKWTPNHTDAFEFQDGKLIMGKMRAVYELTWESVVDAVGGVAALARHIQSSDLVGMLNWNMLPYMSQIWRGIIDEVVPLVSFDGTPPYFFFDLTDPAKRSIADIRGALDLICELDKTFRVVLGLNEREARLAATALGVANPENLSYEELGAAVYGRMPVHCIVIHPTRCAFAITKDGYAYADGPYCENPVLTTGAGDNFNAGFSLGMLRGLGAADALRTGVCASGYYVRHGRSATIKELAAFMEGI